MLEEGAYRVYLPSGKVVTIPHGDDTLRANRRRQKNILAARAWRLEQKVGPEKKLSRPRADLVRAFITIAEFRAGVDPGSVLSKRRRGAVTKARWEVITRLKRLGYCNAAIRRALNIDHASVVHALQAMHVNLGDGMHNSLHGTSAHGTITPATNEASV